MSDRAETIAKEIARLVLHEALRDLELGKKETDEVSPQFYEALRAKFGYVTVEEFQLAKQRTLATFERALEIERKKWEGQ